MKNKGITLIALVITIILLLILSGIAISQLQNNGLFEKSRLAKEKAQNAQVKEDDMLKEYENAINNGKIVSDRDTVTLTEEEYEIFKNQTTFSPNEKVIGIWTNGKSIYRKVLSANDLNITPTKNTSRYSTSIDLTQLNMDKIISCTGYIEVLENSTNSLVFAIGSSKMSPETYMQRTNYIFNNSLIYESVYGNDRVKCYNIILEYTKTTD